MSQATTTVHAEPEHPPFLQHHYHGMGQQFDAGKIGMWLFLVTEVLLFGGLFVGYAIMHAKHPAAFLEAHHQLSRTLGTVNTVVLLVSSFTMVLAVWSAADFETQISDPVFNPDAPLRRDIHGRQGFRVPPQVCGRAAALATITPTTVTLCPASSCSSASIS